MLKEFKEFLLKGNIVDLAVAVVIGAAFGALVASLVANILTPVIAAIVGKPDFSGLHFTINGSVFKYGSFINALITFVSVSAAVFFFVVKPMNILNERRGSVVVEDAAEDEVALLTQIRDALITRGA